MKRALFLALALIGGLTAAPPASATTAYTSVVHPEAAAQPTRFGRMLHEVHPHGGRIYVGYGDYDRNTGPIAIRAYDPAVNALLPTEHTQDTEEVDVFRSIGADLWSPAIDTRSGNDYAVHSAGRWRETDLVPSLHVYDVVQRVPGELLMSGSTNHDCGRTGCGGVVWRSTDGGASWALSLTQNTPARFSRCFEMTTFQSKAYVRCGTGQFVFDGGAWRATNLRVAGYDTVVFDGRLIFTSDSNELTSYDGTTSTKLGLKGTPVVDGGHLYAWGQGRIHRTSSLQRSCGLLALVLGCGPTWSQVGTYDTAKARSLTIMGGRVYLGGYDSRLYRSAAPL